MMNIRKTKTCGDYDAVLSRQISFNNNLINYINTAPIGDIDF